MDTQSLEHLLSTSSKNFLAALQSNPGHCVDYEECYAEDEDGDDYTTEFPCPYCSEEFDIVELCCHFDDEHYGEDKHGLCPVCAMRVVGTNMVAHITTHHGNILRIQHKLKVLKGESSSAISLSLRKELQDEHLKCLLDESSCDVSSSSMAAADPLLSSFMFSMPMADASKSLEPSSSTAGNLAEESSQTTKLERKVQPHPLSHKDHEEKTRRSRFAQGLLWSTIFDDNL